MKTRVTLPRELQKTLHADTLALRKRAPRALRKWVTVNNLICVLVVEGVGAVGGRKPMDLVEKMVTHGVANGRPRGRR